VAPQALPAALVHAVGSHERETYCFHLVMCGEDTEQPDWVARTVFCCVRLQTTMDRE